MGLFDSIKNVFGMQPSEQEQPQNTGLNENSVQPDVISGGFMPFMTKEEAVSFVNTRFEDWRKKRQPQELQWNLNMNFLIGNQYCDINLLQNDIRQIERLYEWQEREVFNQIASIYETRLAKLGRIRPSPFVRPATSENKDISTAKVSTHVLKGHEMAQAMSEMRATASAWSEITGCAFYKHFWNRKAGKLIGNLDGQDIYEGDVETMVISPFEFFPESNFVSMRRLRRWIHAKAYTVDEIFEEFGVKISGREINVFTLNQTSIGTGGLGYNSTIYKYENNVVSNSEIVKEYCELPNKRYPQGLRIIVAGNELIKVEPYIERVGENMNFATTFTMQYCIEVPGRFWPVSIIERLIPIQRSYNAVKNRAHEILNRKAIGVLTVEDNGGTDIENLEEEGLYPGKVLLHDRGTKAPEFLQNTDSINDFDIEAQRLEHMFEKISGVSPFSSQSLPPTGVNSGIGMEKIREQDDTRISLTAENVNKAAINGFKIVLRLYKQFAKGPRITRYVGLNNEIQVVEWLASDLTSDDVIIEKEDELSQTPAQRKQMVLDLLQYGLFETDKVDPRTRNKVIELLELGNWEALDDTEELHVNRAMRENKLLAQGIMPQIDEDDLDAIHIREHVRHKLDVAYEQFAQQFPAVAQVFQAHINQHKAKQQSAMMAMMAPAMAPAMAAK